MGNWKPRTNLDLETPTWSLQHLYEKKEMGKIILPRFQRGPVWDDRTKRELINSILNNYPIGALLLYDNGEEISVIDGLQRTQAIGEFMQHPAVHENLDDFLLSNFWDKVSKDWNQVTESFRGAVHHILKQKDHSELDNLQAHEFQKEIEELLNIKIDDAKKVPLYDDLTTLINELKSMYGHVKEYQVPILLVRGDRTYLPEVFRLINTKGTPLTKYQIFGATWSDFGISITDPTTIAKFPLLNEIVDIIKKRYEGWQKANWKLDFNPNDIDMNNLSLYELILGYSLYIQKTFDFIPGGGDEPEVGFVSMFGYHAVKTGTQKSVMGSDFIDRVIDTSGVSRINGNIQTWKKESENISEKLVEIANLFNEAYKKIGNDIRFLNQVKISSARIENTLYHMVCMAIWLVQNNIQSVNTEAIVQRYVFDILAQKWRGTGDQRLFVQSKTNDYIKKIDKSEWKGIWDAFLREEDHTFDTGRSALNTRQRILMKVVYSDLQTVFQSASTTITFEDDHIFPISKLTEIFETGGPINHIGNRSLIQKIPNRKKGTMLPHEYIQTAGGKKEKKELKAFWGLNKATLWKEMIDTSTMIEKAIGSKSMTDKELARKGYMKFVEKRCSVLLDIMSTVLKIQ